MGLYNTHDDANSQWAQNRCTQNKAQGAACDKSLVTTNDVGAASVALRSLSLQCARRPAIPRPPGRLPQGKHRHKTSLRQTAKRHLVSAMPGESRRQLLIKSRLSPRAPQCRDSTRHDLPFLPGADRARDPAHAWRFRRQEHATITSLSEANPHEDGQVVIAHQICPSNTNTNLSFASPSRCESVPDLHLNSWAWHPDTSGATSTTSTTNNTSPAATDPQRNKTGTLEAIGLASGLRR